MKVVMMFVVLIVSIGMSVQAAEVETLLGARFSKGRIEIQVVTYGCTFKESFAVSRQQDFSSGAVSVLFLRVVPDLCEAYRPEGRVITFSFDELKVKGGQPFYIANPFRIF
jgi:hypothetical protein